MARSNWPSTHWHQDESQSVPRHSHGDIAACRPSQADMARLAMDSRHWHRRPGTLTQIHNYKYKFTNTMTLLLIWTPPPPVHQSQLARNHLREHSPLCAHSTLYCRVYSPPKMQIKHDGGLPRSDRLLSSKPHRRALGWDQTNLLKLKPASVFNAEDETRFQPQPWAVTANPIHLSRKSNFRDRANPNWDKMGASHARTAS